MPSLWQLHACTCPGQATAHWAKSLLLSCVPHSLASGVEVSDCHNPHHIGAAFTCILKEKTTTTFFMLRDSAFGRAMET